MSDPQSIDLRSDTVTQPTPAMRQAMAEAELGDDVYGEDPTVRRLEEMAAERMGKEAAVLVTSGTMGNLTSLLAHCGRGDEAIVGDEAHVPHYEAGGVPALGAIQLRTVPNDGHGMLDLAAVEATIRGKNVHFPRTAAVCLENTHNRCGGRALPVAYMDAAGQLAHDHGLKFHVDGARLWNAAVALNVSPARPVQAAGSVVVCLSQGLAAPVGSLVVGDQEFMRRARRMRKVVGGGMRQAGVIAAAGIVAITEMVERLADDHANARRLAAGLNRVDGIAVDPETVQTDIVIFDLDREDITPADLAAGLRQHGVLLSPIGGQRLRAVTHYHVTEADTERTLAAFVTVFDAGAQVTDTMVITYG